jgi:ATP-binding dynein motor region
MAMHISEFQYLFHYIITGDKTIEWDENFRLFFTTKLANPHYSPEVMGKTMIINYGVNMDGLTNQLLNVVVTTERSDLETQWADLVNEMSADALLLVTLEDTLLRELSSSQVRHHLYFFNFLLSYFTTFYCNWNLDLFSLIIFHLFIILFFVYYLDSLGLLLHLF